MELSRQAKIVDLWTTVMGRGEVDINVLRIFYLVAQWRGDAIPQATVRDTLSLSEAGVSRNVALLSVGASVNTRGPGLIESFEDPEYRRRKLIRLTSKGRRFADSLENV